MLGKNYLTHYGLLKEYQVLEISCFWEIDKLSQATVQGKSSKQLFRFKQSRVADFAIAKDGPNQLGQVKGVHYATMQNKTMLYVGK